MLSPTLTLPTEIAVRPRLGFAGVGWIGRNRLEAILQDARCEIAAVADSSLETAIRLGEELHIPSWHSSFEELLHMDLDGIVIATPSALHAEQSIACLERGIAVFCQKPLGRNYQETRAVIEAAKNANRLLGVDLSYRHTAGMQAIKDLIVRGELGEVYAVDAVFHNAYGPAKPWFYDRNLSGGGCLLDLGIHLVDLILWALDARDVVSAHGLIRKKAGASVEDFACGQLRLENGTTAQIACSWNAHAGCDAEIRVTFFGSKGGARFHNVNGSFLDFRAEFLTPNRTSEVLVEPRDAWGGRAAVQWASRLAFSSAFDPTIEQLSTVAKTLDDLYRSNA